jgi:hypothetical protein
MERSSMHRHRFVLVALMLLVAAAAAFPQVSIEVAEGRMAVTIDIDVRFTAARSIAPEDTHDAVPGMLPARALGGGRRGRTSSAEGIAGWERLRGSRSPWID